MGVKVKRLILLCLLFLTGGFFLASASPAFASIVKVTGKATAANTGAYLDFTNYNSNVTIDTNTGVFSGYAFSEDLGWVAFGSTDNPSGPVTLNLGNGVVSGKAYIMNSGEYLYFSNNNSNVRIDLQSGAFSGYVWSQDVGWYNFANPGVYMGSFGQPVAYWKFDEGYGTTVHDNTINHNDGTLSGTTSPSWQTEDQCVSGKCLSFNGSSSYALASSYSYPSFSGVTLSYWFKAAPNWSSWTAHVVGYDSGSSQGIVYCQFDATNQIDCYVRNASNSVVGITTNSTISANQWYFVSVTYDGSNVRLYLNGLPNATSVSQSGSLHTFNQVYFGSSTGPSLLYNGRLDEVKIYPYARSDAQVKADYNSRGSAKGAGAVMGVATNNQFSALNNGLVGYWKMDEATWSGTLNEVIDSSGNGNNGTAQGPTKSKAYSGSPGKFGNAGQFDGVDNFVGIPNSSSLNVGSVLTSSAWVKTTKKALAEVFSAEDGGGVHGWQMEMVGGDAGAFCQGTNDYDSGASVSDGNWHFWVNTYDGKNVEVYVDGVLKMTAACAPNNTTINYTIGAQCSGPGYTLCGLYNEWWKGSIDEVRIYNRILSQQDIQNLYNYAPGPVAYYNFEDATGSTLTDKSGYGNNGTWQGTLGSQWKQGKYGWGGNFNGTDNYVSIPDKSNIELGGGDFTVSAWTYNTDAAQFVSEQIFCKDNGAANCEYGLNLFTTGNTYDVYAGLSTATITPASGTGPLYNQWQYLTMVRKGTTVSVYSNGILAGSAILTGTSTTSNSLEIGSIQNNYRWMGIIDDVRIYNYAISQKQIIQDMNGGASTVSVGGGRSGPIGYWKFDEGYGTTANNAGNGGATWNGNISGATWINDGKFGRAVNFNGSSNYISLASTGSINTNAYTVSAWIRAVVSGNTYERIFYKGNSSTIEPISAYLYNGLLSCEYYNNPTDYYARDTVDLRDNKWHYVACVRDPGNKIYAYVDGKLKVTANDGGDTTTVASNYSIGSRNGSDSYFYGAIDDLKFYNYILTSSEIQMDYNHNSATVLGAYSSTLTNGLVGYWKMDEPLLSWNGTAGEVKDSSGNNINGTGNSFSSNSPVVGKYGNAGSFNGTSQYVSANGLSIGTNSFTLSAWIKTASAANYQSIISYEGTIRFRFQVSGGALDYGIYPSGGPFVEKNDSGYDLRDNKWHHIAVTFNRSGLATSYVDGVAKGTLDISSASGVNLTGWPTNIGFDGWTASSYFPGSIDEVRIYNRALSADEIQALYTNSQSGFSASGTYCVPGDSSMCNPPVGEWNFDERYGSIVNDISGNGNNGTWTGTGSAHWVAGKYNGAGNFNGLDDNVSVAHASSINNLPAITASAWIYPKSVNATYGNYIIGKHQTVDSSPLPYKGWGLYLATGASIGYTNTIMFAVDFGTDHLEVNGVSNAIKLNQWQYIEVTWNGTAGTGSSSNVHIYVNGREITYGNQGDSSGTRYSDTSYNLKIGNSGDGLGAFNGSIDSVKLYNYARTPAQIAWDYNRGGPVGWWKFDECQGTVAHDNSGFGNDGTITIGTGGGTGHQDSVGTCIASGATAWYNGRNGKFNSSLNFDGIDDYVDVGKSPLFNFEYTNSFSISAWIKTSSSANTYIVNKMDGSVKGYAFLMADSGLGDIEFCVTHDVSHETCKEDMKIVSDGQWHHIVATYNGSGLSSGITLYTDGVLQQQRYTGDALSGGSIVNNVDLQIGQVAGWPAFDNFPGQIDDARIFNYVLTPLQVKLLYNGGGAVNFAPITGSP